MTTPDILRRAAGEVRMGWGRIFRHKRGKVCALGALENAVSFSTETSAEDDCPDAVTALAKLLPPIRCTGAPSALMKIIIDAEAIAFWNDDEDQTAENVAATMELAAICFEQALEQPASTNAVDPQVEVLESGTRA